jgi:hypothetical protein
VLFLMSIISRYGNLFRDNKRNNAAIVRVKCTEAHYFSGNVLVIGKHFKMEHYINAARNGGRHIIPAGGHSICLPTLRATYIISYRKSIINYGQ